MLRLFVGFDNREAVGFHTFVQSVIEKTSVPIQITPLTGEQRDGTNSFTYARFLVPYLCNYQGYALFVDGTDMLLLEDLAELWAEREPGYAVKVIKHNYETKHPVKYVGTELEASNQDYPRKNWSSVILWDCASYLNRQLTPEFIDQQSGSYLHRFEWLPDDRIGSLPPEWNVLVGEEPVTDAKLLHYTLGIPAFSHYASWDGSEQWKATLRRAQRGLY